MLKNYLYVKVSHTNSNLLKVIKGLTIKCLYDIRSNSLSINGLKHQKHIYISSSELYNEQWADITGSALQFLRDYFVT